MTSPVSDALLEAGDALAETVKMLKASLVATLTKKELSILMDDLHKWNVASLAMKAKEEAADTHGPHCSDYHQACRQCLDRFNAWKAADQSPADEELPAGFSRPPCSPVMHQSPTDEIERVARRVVLKMSAPTPSL